VEGAAGHDWGWAFWLALAATSLRVSLPYFLTALGATFSEKGGVINIGLEGMMMAGGLGYVLAAHFGAGWGPIGAPVAGILAGVLAGAALASLLTLATVYLRAEQIVSGLAINMLALAGARYALDAIFDSSSQSAIVAKIAPWKAFASDSPLSPLSEILHPLLLLGALLLLWSEWTLANSRFGLRLRAAGEHPLAADTLGVNVLRTRLWGVLISGALAGLAGVYLAADQGLYSNKMTAGRGYIALAIMIAGKWRPRGALVGALVFGFAEALADRLQARGDFLKDYHQLIQMTPYLLTLAALAGFIGGAKPPAAVGQPYAKERAR
jgi:ABC-type uncharacterized transport system permease subunit